MFAICIESSHKRGMGHLFRALNLILFLEEKNEPYIVFINDDDKAIDILRSKGIKLEVVDLLDYESNWESRLIEKYNITVWVNDRLDTDVRHASNVLNGSVKLVTFDDNGSGAELADINFAGMEFDDNLFLKGKRVYHGIDYLILNKEIDKYKRIREKIDRIIVTLGGSDTYGVTLKVVKLLKEKDISADILIGPSFLHEKELFSILDNRFSVKKSVPSLISEFYKYDLAITGGGVTPFEANASGLPCIIIANEMHEIKNGEFLDKLGSSVFAGYHENIDTNCLSMNLNIHGMSKRGIEMVTTEAVDRIYKIIKDMRDNE